LDQIQKLSKLWLVSGVNGKFYPDAPIENKDFVVIIARTLLLKQWATQSFIDSFYYLKPLLNVSTTTAYAPYLEYCLEFEMCATLLTQTSWGVSFQPNRMLSRHEVVPIILATTQGKLEAVPRGEWSITRGELANLLIRSLESSPAGTNQPEKKAEESAGAKSRRETFQDLMKIS
jgi:hypothetical protein